MHLPSISPCTVIPDFTPITSVHHKVPPWHRWPDNWRNSCWNPLWVSWTLSLWEGSQQCTRVGLVPLCYATYLSTLRDHDRLHSQTNPLTSTIPHTLFCSFFDSPGHCLHYSYFYYWDFQIEAMLFSSLLQNLSFLSVTSLWFSALVNKYYPRRAASSLLPGTVPTCLIPAMWNYLHFLSHAFFHLSILICTLFSSRKDSRTLLPGSCLLLQVSGQVLPSGKPTMTTLWNCMLVDASIVHLAHFDHALVTLY